ncbi:MAG: L,D-transpeptidase, partial [Candidatus Latescibacterota bacterium]
PVTHGCVRLDDEDLKIVYQNLMLGSAVYIY